MAFLNQKQVLEGLRPWAIAAWIAGSLASGCATGGPRPKALPGEVEEVDRDRQQDQSSLRALSGLLGKPFPKAFALTEEEQTGLDEVEADVLGSWTLQSHRLRVRATSVRSRIVQLEIRFPDGCDAQCGNHLTQTLSAWLAPVHRFKEGRARFAAVHFDTSQVRLEVFPARPDLTRLLLVCGPLKDEVMGRVSLRTPIGASATSSPARCRQLPPATH